MRYFKCFGTNRFCKRATVVSVVLLFCSFLTLSADNQDSSHGGNTPSPCQAPGTNSGARYPADQSQGEPDEKPRQGSCITHCGRRLHRHRSSHIELGSIWSGAAPLSDDQGSG